MSFWQNIFNEKCRNSSWMHQVNGRLFDHRGGSYCAVVWCKPPCKVGIFGNALCDCSGSLWVLYQLFAYFELQSSSKSSQHVLPTWEDKGASMVSKLKHVSSEPFESASCQPHEAILNFYDLFQPHISYLCAIGSLSPWDMMSWGPLLRARPRILEL